MNNQPKISITRPVALLLAVAAGLFRFLPIWLRPFNLAPMGAVGLFGGARLRSWQAFALPLALMVGTDCVLCALRGFDPDYGPFHFSRPFVYGSFLLYVVIGRLLVQTESFWRIGLASMAGSLQFFLVTNFGDWLNPVNGYNPSLAGLWNCYLAGLPFYNTDHPVGFFGWTILSDLGFSALLFGAHAMLTRTVAPAERVPGMPATTSLQPSNP